MKTDNEVILQNKIKIYQQNYPLNTNPITKVF